MKNIKFLIAITSFFFFNSCSFFEDSLNENLNEKIITIKGSDTVFPIIEASTVPIHNTYSNISVSLSGGGSGDGIKALIAGQTDIAMSSRDIKSEEEIKLKAKNIRLQKRIIAYDGIAVIVHPSNPISRLTKEQIQAIYTGKVKNWSELGGNSLPIEIYSRESSSGTYEFFQDVILEKKEYCKSMLSTFVTEAIVKSVEISKGAIGYVGLAYKSPKCKLISVSFNNGRSYISPSEKTIKNSTYRISRPLYFFYDEKSKTSLSDILKFILSTKGQKIVSEVGYINL